jgi:hypothetical protein
LTWVRITFTTNSRIASAIVKAPTEATWFHSVSPSDAG